MVADLIKIESYTLDIYGSRQDYDYYLVLKNYIENNNLNNHVNFIFDCNNIQNILFKYDYAFHCSTSETGPLVLLEYMAHGIPFLTGNTGHIINFLKPKLDFLIIDKFIINDWIEGFKYLKSKSINDIVQKFDYLFKHNFSEKDYYSNCLKIYRKSLY